MKTIVLLLILFCLCEGQKKPPGKPPGEPPGEPPGKPPGEPPEKPQGKPPGKPPGRPKPKPKPKPKPPGGYGCPKNWVRFRDTDRCYYVSGRYDTFEYANQFCRDAKGELAVPLTCDAHIDLTEILAEKRLKCNKRQNCDDYWIGIQNASGNNWQTTKGVKIVPTQQCQHWYKNFPKSSEGGCVSMSLRGLRKNRGYWRNANCTSKIRFACIACPNDFEFIPEINECLLFNSTRVTWSVAQETCSKYKKGAQMLTIDGTNKNEAVKTYLQPLMTKHGKTCEVAKWRQLGAMTWIGAQTKSPTVCGTPYVWKPSKKATIPLSYSNWFPGVPNCGYNIENCAAICTSKTLNYRWEDLPCSEELCFACEF